MNNKVRLTAKTIVRLLGNLIECTEDFEETMIELADVSYDLRVGGASKYEKDLGKLINEKVKEVVEERDICPGCFNKLETVEVSPKTYYEPAHYRAVCSHCGYNE